MNVLHMCLTGEITSKVSLKKMFTMFRFAIVEDRGIHTKMNFMIKHFCLRIKTVIQLFQLQLPQPENLYLNY